MGMVGILMKQRDMIMDRYIALMKKFDSIQLSSQK